MCMCVCGYVVVWSCFESCVGSKKKKQKQYPLLNERKKRKKVIYKKVFKE